MWRSPRCGWWGQTAELGARILGLEAANVRGDVVNLLVRFRVMNIGKALLSIQDLNRCGWETVFPAGCGNAYLVRRASDTRMTLVKKRCAWYLRVKLKPHNELPYTESEKFLEVMSMDQRAGVWPVEEGGSSGSSGPAVSEDIEESEPVKKLVAPTAPTATDREEGTASGHAAFRTWCRECCIGRGRLHQHRAGGRETTTPAIAIDYGMNVTTCCKRRREPRFWSESVTVIVGLAQPLCQQRVQTSLRLLNSRTM